jgi:hypothetical protein
MSPGAFPRNRLQVQPLPKSVIASVSGASHDWGKRLKPVCEMLEGQGLRMAMGGESSSVHSMRLLILAFVLLVGVAGAKAAMTNAWERTDAYVPPDFNGYFADDAAGGERLTGLERDRELESLPANEVVAAVQKGFRRTQSHKLSILRTLGNRFIWGKSPQNPEAIELMYHAIGYPNQPDPENVRHFALWFGLSVVQSKTGNILHALVDLCMRTEEPGIFDRVAWGIASQQQECLAYLEPCLKSNDESVKAKAQLVQRFLRKEANPFEWATEEARKRAQAKYQSELPEIKRRLVEGSSEERQNILKKIFDGQIQLIMDESFIPAFASCARDVDWRIRDSVTKTVGQNWIWSAHEQSSAAIDLMLQLSYDPEHSVKYSAVYFGLSVVREKSDAVLRRLVELSVRETDLDMVGRINWGLQFGQRSVPEKVVQLKIEYLTDPDPRIAKAAETWYRSWLQSSGSSSVMATPAKSIGTNALPEIRQRLDAGFRPFSLRLADGQGIFVAKRNCIAIGDGIVVLVEAEDRVRTVDVRQIKAIEDLPSGSSVVPNSVREVK